MGKKKECERGGADSVEVAAVVPFPIAVEEVGGNRNIAKRIAELCQGRLRAGLPLKEVEDFRDELYQEYREMNGADDVAEDSDAWARCKVSCGYGTPAVSFTCKVVGTGVRVKFQTTVIA